MSTVSDILSCLTKKEAKLSTACSANLFTSKSKQNRWNQVKDHYRQITNTTSAISIIYVAVPMLIALWATYKFHCMITTGNNLLSKINSSTVSTNSSLTESTTNVSQSIGNGSALSDDDLVASTPLVSLVHNPQKHTLEIGFMNICYSAIHNVSMMSKVQAVLNYPRSVKTAKHQILQNICGDFSHSSITAIMGPSGSGNVMLLFSLIDMIMNE